jgi:tyramine---L-glutamate ligase
VCHGRHIWLWQRSCASITAGLITPYWKTNLETQPSSGKSFKTTAVLFGFGDHEALRILLYEHVSSGGFAGESIPPSLLCEGFSMLRGLTADFKAAGHEVTVLLDSRIAKLCAPLVADHVVQIASSGEADPTMERAAETVDAAYVVASEPNHVLQSIVECIETTGALSLNCQAKGIELAADKTLLGERVKNLRLNFPKTEIFHANDPIEEITAGISGELSFPVVIKPESGAGCSGLSVIQNEMQVAMALAKIRKETATGDVAAQELIGGVPGSVSLISTGTEALPVSLNLQVVNIDGPDGISSYEGGSVPLEHPLREEAFASAKQVVESFGYLRGYVGVDLILTENKAFIIEVNPRLTTSFVGLRKVANFNIAQAIADAVLKNELPKNPRTNGCGCFSKVPVSHQELSAWQDICGMQEVISPPFVIGEADLSYALVQASGDTFEKASLALREAKKHLQHLCQGGK